MTTNLNSSLAGLSLLSGTNSFATFSIGGPGFETLAVRRAKAAFTTPASTPPWKQADPAGSLSSQVSAIRRMSSIIDAGPATGRKLPEDVASAFTTYRALDRLRVLAEAAVAGPTDSVRETLQGVIEARASATRPEIQVDTDDLNDPEAMAQYQDAQNQFGSALSRLLVSVEQYPELRSQENFGRFMTQLEGSENRVRITIRDYNEAVRQYNTTIRTFPDIIGAKVIHGAEPMVPYEAATEGAEVAPELDMRSE